MSVCGSSWPRAIPVFKPRQGRARAQQREEKGQPRHRFVKYQHFLPKHLNDRKSKINQQVLGLETVPPQFSRPGSSKASAADSSSPCVDLCGRGGQCEAASKGHRKKKGGRGEKMAVSSSSSSGTSVSVLLLLLVSAVGLQIAASSSSSSGSVLLTRPLVLKRHSMPAHLFRLSLRGGEEAGAEGHESASTAGGGGVDKEEDTKKEGVANLREAIKELKIPASVAASPEAVPHSQQWCVVTASIHYHPTNYVSSELPPHQRVATPPSWPCIT